MKKLAKNQGGFGVIEVLLTLIILGLIVFTAYYVWNAKQDTDKTLKPTDSTVEVKKNTPSTTTDKTASWTAYTNKTAGFSLKYPKTWVTPAHPDSCGKDILMLGADDKSVGTCASENAGQMTISSRPDEAGCQDLSGSSWTQNSKETVTVSGVTGTKTVATAKEQGDGMGALPKGTKMVQYCFVTSGTTYTANYTQLSTYPDVLDDFNAMVNKTLKFE